MQRQVFLRHASVCLGLPVLDCFSEGNKKITRLVAMQMPFGFLPENLYPGKEGSSFSTTYLNPLRELRDEVTLYKGLYNPGISCVHDANYYFLTCGSKHKKTNTISLDQEIASRYKGETRYRHLISGVGLRAGLSYSRSGIKIPVEESPKRVFENLFLKVSSENIQKQKHDLHEGKSILDGLFHHEKKMAPKASSKDRHTMDQFFTAVREVEQELTIQEAWLEKPLPSVERMKFPSTSRNEIENFRTFIKLFSLVLQTDSTRLITYDFGQTRAKLELAGVEEGYHGLSLHGQNHHKLEQLRFIELEMFQIWSSFLKDLKERDLLKNTICLFGSGLENPNNHSAAQPPVLIAGGGLKHQGYVDLSLHKKPLGGLYLNILDEFGIHKETFGSGSSRLGLG